MKQVYQVNDPRLFESRRTAARAGLICASPRWSVPGHDVAHVVPDRAMWAVVGLSHDDENAIAHSGESPSSQERPSRLVDPTARVQVYFQGLLDGACFLYAQANAHKALTGRRVTRENWNSAVSRLPDSARFLGGAGATDLGYDEASRLIRDILGAFSDPGETFTLGKLSSSAAIADLCSAVSADSVVVFAYGGRTEFQHPASHIVCGVAASDDGARLHLACSAAFSGRYLPDGEYFERHHAHLRRWSNDSISADSDVVIAPNFRWRITFQDRAG